MENLTYQKQAETTASIKINNAYTHKHLIIYTDKCDMTIYRSDETLFFKQGMLVFIERGIRYRIAIKKYNLNRPPFQCTSIDSETLHLLKDIMHSLYAYKLDENTLNRKTSDKIIGVNTCDDYVSLLDKINKTSDKRIQAIKLAYLITKMPIKDSLIYSLYISAASTFTDKVRRLVSEDLSKKWRLSIIADKFNISEITVRKRLECEHTSFNHLLLDLRMNKAMQLLLENEKQIHQISKLTGFSSTSYFIKLFRSYFGVTPKQYMIYFRS
ncbi:helix-turn-helix transcriptional regulator [Kosakonia sp. MUSA4]|uniref:helix-turn-helix transcriptional regulator n=1 Tax=Kosakonia sp. MUSA4 TaxID=2067958 RepID=UPI001597E6F8|nr:helix-turn-helix transcriptional regulator [Kosakonia sp. MUSA4]QJT78901.1 AraC family transcriptional regulator [Kosakonia sp. MUSA4]